MHAAQVYMLFLFKNNFPFFRVQNYMYSKHLMNLRDLVFPTLCDRESTRTGLEYKWREIEYNAEKKKNETGLKNFKPEVNFNHNNFVKILICMCW